MCTMDYAMYGKCRCERQFSQKEINRKENIKSHSKKKKTTPASNCYIYTNKKSINGCQRISYQMIYQVSLRKTALTVKWRVD